MNTGVFLLLGTNQGDKFENLSKARRLITESAVQIVRASSIYKTAAWGNTLQEEFFNQVLEVKTVLNASALLEAILHIETIIGRIRTEHWGPRIIDIDILFYNKVIKEPALVVPHPGIPQRRFTLEPLCEIAPKFIHPAMEKSIRTLLAECSDPLEVVKISV